MTDTDNNSIQILEVRNVPFNLYYTVNYKGEVVTVSVSKRKASTLTERELAAHLLPKIREAVMEVKLSMLNKFVSKSSK